MRRIRREQLEEEISTALDGFGTDVQLRLQAGGLDASAHWGGKRKTQPILSVLAVLKRMAGKRERCMYCVDSEAADIEHFWPKTQYPGRMYLWENLLLCCSNCGSNKSAQFPVNGTGKPLLIDPTLDDPWEDLDFDPITGNLCPRFILASGDFSERGRETVRILHLDRREGLSEGYRMTYSRVGRLIEDWTVNGVPEDYLERLIEVDDHGLLGWFLRGAGSREPAVARFREQYGNVWAECARVFL